MGDHVYVDLFLDGVRVPAPSDVPRHVPQGIPCIAYDETGSLGMADLASVTVSFTKQVDASSPLITRGFFTTQAVDATFHVMRQLPTGQEQLIQTWVGSHGRIESMHRSTGPAAGQASLDGPVVEQVVVRFATFSWTTEPGGAAFAIGT